jgi:hypothetical protein
VAVGVQSARALAVRLHGGDVEESGASVLAHLERVASRTPVEARAIAWLHEVLEGTTVSERALLESGVTTEELRALRLLCRTSDSRSDRVYLAHVDLIACAAGPSGRLARAVKVADLEDRLLHPRVRPDGWSPPYARALQRLEASSDVDVDDLDGVVAVAEPVPRWDLGLDVAGRVGGARP